MQLNDEQREFATENHNLIYGYIHKRGLNVEEWYGIIAIEYCKAIMAYDKDRSAFSTYFYMRCESKVQNTFRNKRAKKRQHNGMLNLESTEFLMNDMVNYEDEALKSKYLMDDLLEENKHEQDLLELSYQGYTQYEIADMLGTSQPDVSRRLRKIKRRYI